MIDEANRVKATNKNDWRNNENGDMLNGIVQGCLDRGRLEEEVRRWRRRKREVGLRKRSN